jgi:hypothetical protein
MGSRIVDGLVALAVLLSAAALVLLFARPFIWPPTDGSRPVPSATTAPSGSPTAGAPTAPKPVGSYVLPRVLRPGVCIGIELDDASYPATAEEEGAARVSWWATPVTDPGNEEACADGIGELHHLDATVTVLGDRTDPDAPPVGYTLHFPLPVPVEGAEAEAVELTLLTSRSTPNRLQALDAGATGFLGGGLVLERVAEIAPSLVPLPSSSPEPSGG